MKRLLLILAVLLLPVMGYATACPTGYSNVYPLIIATQSTLSSDQSNFPVYFAGNSLLAATGSGGQSQSSGLDVVWCDAASSGNLLSYELVAGTYSATTGVGEWWIKVPTVSHTSAQIIYAMVGKVSDTDHSSMAATWSSYLGVWHGGTSSTLTLTDSTGNATATNHGATAVAGKMNGAASYVTGSSQWTDTGSTQTGLTNFTLEAWVGPKSTATALQISSRNSGTTGGIFMCQSCDGPGTGTVSVGYSNGSNYYFVAAGALGSSGTFAHVAGTHVSGSANQTLYINGAANAGTVLSLGTPTDPANSGTTLQFGRDGAATPNYYTGYLDEVRLSGSVRSADWIKASYLNQSAPGTFSVFNPSVATPTYSPVAGPYGSNQTVTISDSTGGAAIVYCIDTTNTCTPSTSYTASVTVTLGSYLRAQATASGYTSSVIASGLYSAAGGTARAHTVIIW